MFYYFPDGHIRSNFHVSLRYGTLFDWYEEIGNQRKRSYGDTFDLSMEPAVEFLEFDRSDEYLESTIEPEPAVF